MNDKDYIKDVFTKENDDVNLEVNNVSVTCLTSNNNNFSLDSDGNLTVKSINVLNGESLAMQDVFDKVYPIGSIYMTFSGVVPTALFGGTWERITKGRTLIGVDENDTDFDVVQKVGGSKYLQQHKHLFRAVRDTNTNCQGKLVKASNIDGANTGLTEYRGGPEWLVGNVDDVQTGNSGNLQPYITCYIWNRVA